MLGQPFAWHWVHEVIRAVRERSGGGGPVCPARSHPAHGVLSRTGRAGQSDGCSHRGGSRLIFAARSGEGKSAGCIRTRVTIVLRKYGAPPDRGVPSFAFSQGHSFSWRAVRNRNSPIHEELLALPPAPLHTRHSESVRSRAGAESRTQPAANSAPTVPAPQTQQLKRSPSTPPSDATQDTANAYLPLHDGARVRGDGDHLRPQRVRHPRDRRIQDGAERRSAVKIPEQPSGGAVFPHRADQGGGGGGPGPD